MTTDPEVERIARLMHDAARRWYLAHPQHSPGDCPWDALAPWSRQFYYDVARVVIDDPGKRM